MTQDYALIEAPLRSQIRPGGSRSKSRAFLICPCCEAPMTIRDSQRQTSQVKQLTCQCSNPGCNASCIMQVSLVYLLNPGLHYTPEMDLPLCPRDRIPQIYPPSSDAKPDDRQVSMFEANSGQDTS
ncbi:MAG: ogr/Delta-like zinc finger family protein [Sphingomonadaceae bacterium]|nr:ogr/Delta-like zinc finger family protein [Sphingomonadaceae bacterium]